MGAPYAFQGDDSPVRSLVSDAARRIEAATQAPHGAAQHGPQEAVVPEPPLVVSNRHLHALINAAHEELTCLQDRLKPILRQAAPSTGATSGGEIEKALLNGGTSELSESLYAASVKLAQLIERTRATMYGLEL